MILRDCDTCERRTEQDREQWAEDAVIYTEYTCTQCGTIDICTKKFSSPNA